MIEAHKLRSKSTIARDLMKEAKRTRFIEEHGKILSAIETLLKRESDKGLYGLRITRRHNPLIHSIMNEEDFEVRGFTDYMKSFGYIISWNWDSSSEDKTLWGIDFVINW